MPLSMVELPCSGLDLLLLAITAVAAHICGMVLSCTGSIIYKTPGYDPDKT